MGETQELYCPVCKIDSFINPNIKLFISPCFHKLCEQCLSRIFSAGPGLCPTCGLKLRKINFMSSTFEDVEVEKEMKIRGILKSFYQIPRNPVDICRFNDWLEFYENYVFELTEVHGDLEIKNRIKRDYQDPKFILNAKTVVDKAEEPSLGIKHECKRIKIEEEIFGIPSFVPTPHIINFQHPIPETLFKFNENEYISPELIYEHCLFQLNSLQNE